MNNIFYKKEKNQIKIKQRLLSFHLFALYMIIINLICLFYTNFYSNDYFNKSQIIANFIYNSICIIITSIIFFYFKFLYRFYVFKKEGNENSDNLKFEKFSKKNQIYSFLINLYFICKINLDFFNLILITQITQFFILLLFLNSTIYYNIIIYSKVFMLYKNSNINLIIQMLILLSLSFFFSNYVFYDKSKEIILIELNEVIKLIYLIYLIIMNNIKNIIIEYKKVKKKNIIEMNKIINFLLSNLETSKINGIIIFKNSDEIYTNNNYFEYISDILKNKNNNSMKRKGSNKNNTFNNLSNLENENIKSVNIVNNVDNNIKEIKDLSPPDTDIKYNSSKNL